MMGGTFTDTGMPSWRAASIVMGKSWVPPAGPLATASAPTMTPSRSLGSVLFRSPHENEIRCQELQEPSEHHRRALPFNVKSLSRSSAPISDGSGHTMPEDELGTVGRMGIGIDQCCSPRRVPAESRDEKVSHDLCVISLSAGRRSDRGVRRVQCLCGVRWNRS